jgi:hypothetical protein
VYRYEVEPLSVLDCWRRKEAGFEVETKKSLPCTTLELPLPADMSASLPQTYAGLSAWLIPRPTWYGAG